MPILPFSEFRPDVKVIDSGFSRSILDVLPQADGYGPFRDLAAYTNTLPARCRGYFFARNTDASVTVFAGTETKLYMLNNTTLAWSDVSRGLGTYTTMDVTAQWSFAQFGNRVICTQDNDNVQDFVLGVSTQFADLAGSPPDAAYVTVVGSFVVLSGLAGTPFRIHWSAIGDATGWTAGTNQSDFQDLPDGGVVRQVKGGELGIIFQDSIIRRMIFSPGSDVIFAIDKIGTDIGLLHPLAVALASNRIFALTGKGFVEMGTDGTLKPIGFERVDKTFFADYDSNAPQFIIAACDPNAFTVLFTYRTNNSAADAFNKVLAYNWLLERWTPLTVSGEYITSLAQPGATLEGLDALTPGALPVTGAVSNGGPNLIRITVPSTATLVNGGSYTLSAVGGVPNANGTRLITIINGTQFDLQGSVFAGAYTSGGVVGGSMDLFETPLDAIALATLPKISVADTAHAVGFFNGQAREAILETSETSGDGKRIQVNGFWPVTDAPVAFGSISRRENLSAVRFYTPEAPMRANGFCAMIRDTRYSGGKLRIPAGTPWTYAMGIRPEFILGGEQ